MSEYAHDYAQTVATMKKEVAELKAKLAAMEETDKAVEVPEGKVTGEEEKAS